MFGPNQSQSNIEPVERCSWSCHCCSNQKRRTTPCRTCTRRGPTRRGSWNEMKIVSLFQQLLFFSLLLCDAYKWRSTSAVAECLLWIAYKDSLLLSTTLFSMHGNALLRLKTDKWHYHRSWLILALWQNYSILVMHLQSFA